MASSCEASCISDPNFAVICAFLERFASSCGIEFPTFVDLQEMLENVDQVPQELIDLHIKLLRKARKPVFNEKWERALIKFCHTYSSQDGWEIERFGYKKSRLEVKIRVLKMLLEGQFDLNQKFKAQINTLESGELRTKPLGRDKQGRLYWLQTDPVSNIRVYREDMDEESWTLVAKDRPSLVELLQDLSGEESQIGLLNDDSESLNTDKPVTDTGQNGNGSIQDENKVGDEKVDVNGEVNGDAQEQQINGDADKEHVNSDGDKDQVNSDVEKEQGKNNADKDIMNGVVNEEPEVGEAIEESVMYITGEGAGADCEAGNPDKEEEQNEQVEESAPNTSEHDLPSEKQKPTPKLWSIDTICGVNSTEVNEVKHKNFSSFSIDSVLEKKDSDATFSKYTVNCPFESNSVGGEQTSDVNLKTEINNDAVPYQGASGSESSICSSSEDKSSSIKSHRESAGNVHTSMVEPNAELSTAGNKLDTEVRKKLDSNNETAKSDVQEIPTESLVPGEIENTSSSQTDSFSAANRVEDNHIENQTGEVIKPHVELETTPSVNEEKEAIVVKETEANNVSQGDTKSEFLNSNKEVGLVADPALEQKELIEEAKDVLPKGTGEATVEVPKPVEEEPESEEFNASKIPKEKEEEETKSLADRQREKELENQSIIIDEEVSSKEVTGEGIVVEEIPKTDEIEPKQKDECEKTATLTADQNKETESDKEKNDVKIPEQKVMPEEIKSVDSNIQEPELIKNSTKTESEKELQEKIDSENPEETILEEKEAETNEEAVKPSAGTEYEPKIENEYSAEDVQAKMEKISETTGGEAALKNEQEEKKELEKNIGKAEEKNLELTEKYEEKQKEPQEESKSEENDKKREVAVKKQEPEEMSAEIKDKSEEAEGEEQTKEKFSKEIKPDDNIQVKVKTPEEINDEKKTDENAAMAKQEDEKEEKADTNSSIKEEKKIKRELVIAIEKMETIPDIKKEDDIKAETEEADEDKTVPKKLTRSSAKAKESGVEKDEDKETREEDSAEVDKSKKGKKGVRRLSRSRRDVEESSKVEEAPRVTRRMRKSIGLEETPKQIKWKKEKGKEGEEEEEEEAGGGEAEEEENEENDMEVEEEKAEPAKNENEKSEEGEDNEKDAEKQKPQARRAGRKPRSRRRRLFYFSKRKKASDENEKEDGKKNENDKKEENENEKKGEGERGKENKENEEKKEKKRRRKRDEATLLRDRAAQELKLLGVTEDTEVPTVRQSRRIAQIKLKEEAERRRLEALQLESFKKENKKGRKRKKSKHDSDSGDEEKKDKDDEDSDDEVTKKERIRKKKKDKLKFNEYNPWLSSSESSTIDEEEEDLEDETHEDDDLFFKSDHEFSPESDVEDPDYKPIKRARTAKVEESQEKGGKYDDTVCEKCGNKDHPEWILLCDKCDKGWHASCVRPALMVVPEGDWYCPPCEHKSLVEKLKQSLAEYDRTKKQRENEELRRKRLAFVGISLDNVLPPTKKGPKEEEEEKSGSESGSESGSSESDSGSSDSSEPVYQLRERRTNVTSYRYNEYDELIKSALKDEIEAVKGAGNAGRGKDINNIVNAEKQKENENPEEGEDVLEKVKNGNEEEKPKEKSKKNDDEDYDVETEEEKEKEKEEEEEEEEDEEEEDENVVDELPPVVPKNVGLKKKRSKSVKITSLDFTSEEEDNNSDSDFKGTSDEEESECSLPSESESSEEIGRRRRGYDGPVRRSTRARVSRYDRDFINDDSEDDEPKRKRHRSWESSESSDSDRSWGRKKRKKGGSGGRAKKFPTEKKKKKKQKKRPLNSDDDDDEHKPVKKYRSRKIKYGGLDEEPILTRRTRGKKINYQEMNGSDSEDEQPRKTARVIESDDDFVAENDKDEEAQNAESEEIESGVDEDEDTDAEKEKKPTEKKKKILEKIKKKKWVIPDPDDFSEDDLMEEKQLDELNEELEDLDEEEEEILGNILEKGDVPINELRDAVKRAKEESRKKKESGAEKSQPETLHRTFPPIPAHMEFGGGKFPKIGKVKITPSRAELASMGGLPPQGGLPGPGVQPGFNASGFPEKQEDKPEILLRNLPSDKGLGDPNIPSNHSKPEQRPYPYQMEVPPPAGPLTMMAMMNSQQGGETPIGTKNGPPQYPYQGMGGYPPNIPTTVMGISDIETQGKKKPGPKPGTKMKKKVDDGDDNAASGDEFKMESVKAVRGRGKKPEGDAVSTVQPPTQFPPADGGSVITRMLNAPQFESNQFPLRNPPFRPIHFATPPRPPPPVRVRVPGPMFHTSHPHDPSPSGGGPINIPTTKPSPPSPTFNRAPVPIIQRFPDPRFNLQGSPSRPDFSAYGGFYGNYPQPDEAGFQNPPSYPEQFAEGAPPPTKPFEDETGGEFGGLASYFASQREEDLDT